MQWISVVTAVGLAALVNFCGAEEVDVCNGGTASARIINLTIDLTSINYKCCCHLNLKTTQVVWRNMTVGCGITLVHNVSFLGTTCKSRGTSSQKVTPGEIAFDLCVVREDCHAQTQSLQGQLILQATSYDIDVNCSDPFSMIPSTGSTQLGVTEVESTTELTPSTSSGVYIALAVVGGVLTCIGVVCVILEHRRNQNFPVPQETVSDVQVKRYNEDIILHVDNQKETNVPVECACEDNGNRSGQVINGHLDDVDNTVKNQEKIISDSQLTASCSTLKQYIQGNGVGGDYYEDVDNTTTNQKQISESQSTASCNTLEQHRQGNGVSGDYEDIDNTATNHGVISESHPTASCSAQEQYSQGKGISGDYEDIDNTAKNHECISPSQSAASCNSLKQRSHGNVVGGDYEDMDNTADANEQPTGPDKIEFDTCIKDIIQDNAYKRISTGEGNHRPASVLQICHETILKTGDVYAKVKK
ncbi:uncharacterized protein [Haliotis cracherodii]|uniref:uncharacterized protein n=1 Tax=Haliotis cracherodii TaxID=6455 RepID=UPI0039E9C864